MEQESINEKYNEWIMDIESRMRDVCIDAIKGLDIEKQFDSIMIILPMLVTAFSMSFLEEREHQDEFIKEVFRLARNGLKQMRLENDENSEDMARQVFRHV